MPKRRWWPPLQKWYCSTERSVRRSSSRSASRGHRGRQLPESKRANSQPAASAARSSRSSAKTRESPARRVPPGTGSTELAQARKPPGGGAASEESSCLSTQKAVSKAWELRASKSWASHCHATSFHKTDPSTSAARADVRKHSATLPLRPLNGTGPSTCGTGGLGPARINAGQQISRKSRQIKSSKSDLLGRPLQRMTSTLGSSSSSASGSSIESISRPTLPSMSSRTAASHCLRSCAGHAAEPCRPRTRSRTRAAASRGREARAPRPRRR
mmetsp:Transcript_58720/g.171846  ORF Transcript_58720/g.171846 Transcript_58720/m.171846 type:complete len:272 (-) Transcript_58720:334-1149(-)